MILDMFLLSPCVLQIIVPDYFKKKKKRFIIRKNAKETKCKNTKLTAGAVVFSLSFSSAGKGQFLTGIFLKQLI